MQLSAPDFSQRAQLTELMDEPCSRDVQRACLRDIARTNRWTFAYRPMLGWLNAITASIPALDEPLRILDVGCGYGDALRRIEQWAGSRRIAVELTGLDLNSDASAIAAEATSASSSIQWVTADILTYTPPRAPHLVISSLFTHHLDEVQIVEFIRWMEDHAQLGWFISDLSRAPVPYYLFRAFAKLARLHRFVQYDGPVSIARSFVAADWERMCSAAGLGKESVEIQAFKPARLCVSRRKTR
jgi:SAM-dependent methyltransferase